VPARKARGAIVEKGEEARKVIGDYLNNPPNTTNANVRRGLLPITEDQSHSLQLRHRYRGQAPSHIESCARPDYFLVLALAPRWRRASNRHTPVATDTLRLLTLPAIGKCTR